jgi:hypothetical protein
MKATSIISIVLLQFSMMPLLLSGQTFVPVWNTPFNPMTFYVAEAIVDQQNMQAGDEIGIFDIDPNSNMMICVGAAVLSEPISGGIFLEIVTSMNDGSLQGQNNGFTSGNDFIFKFYSHTYGLLENINYSFPYAGYDEVFTALGTAIVDLEASFSSGPTFEPVWTTPFNPMTIYVTEALLDGSDLLPESQIGLFDIDPNNGNEICVGAATLSNIISPSNHLEMIASMTDGSIPGQANGFTPGNSFIVKFITHDGILIDQVDYSFPYSGFDQVYTSLGSSIIELSGIATQIDQHEISISGGWSGISSYLIPDNAEMQSLFENMDELIILQNLMGFYQPGNPDNTLLQWAHNSGYFIKTSDASQLVIEGAMPEEKSIMLNSGWNLIPVLSQVQVDIQDLFDGQMDKVEIIRDAIGFEVFWPEYAINTLQGLTPGKTYLIKMKQAAAVSFE